MRKAKIYIAHITLWSNESKYIVCNQWSKQIWPPISKILTLNLLHKDLTDFRIPASSLTHPSWERYFFLQSWSFQRWIEDSPNSAIFKLSVRSEHFGFFSKRRLKDTELKCLWSKFSHFFYMKIILKLSSIVNILNEREPCWRCMRWSWAHQVEQVCSHRW